MLFTKQKRLDIYHSAILKWGKKSQLEMMQEEATELALAARKFTRYPIGKNLMQLAEEIADVEIMIEQVKIMEADIINEIEVVKDYKLGRLMDRIAANKFN